ncbi:hypothetical protein R1sor_026221 [Riccia sorocarpa]|uniref:Uncharacterized protein n=1 Tax=Riccia sorocarpa TaxID=122646 RepID=A0ABD3GAS5_9MARC
MGAEEGLAALEQDYVNGLSGYVADEKPGNKKMMESDDVTEKLVALSVQQENSMEKESKQIEQQQPKSTETPTAASPQLKLGPTEEIPTTTMTEKEEAAAAPTSPSLAQTADSETKKNEGQESGEPEKKSAYPLPSPESLTGADEKETGKAVPLPETAAGVNENETSVSGNPRELGKEEVLSNINTLLLNDDEVATTLEAASKKLRAAHAREKKKQKSGLAKFLSALSPKRILLRFRDCYVNTCMFASERGDFGNLVAGHPGMFYASENAMSRNSSQKRERDHEEVLASLSRQVSASLSRQASQANTRASSPAFNRTTSTGIAGLSRNASTGIPGMNRTSSTGIAGLNRSGSTGFPSLSRQASSGMNGGAYGRNSSTRRYVPESEVYKAGRSTFLESVAVRNSTSLGGSPARHSRRDDTILDGRGQLTQTDVDV